MSWFKTMLTPRLGSAPGLLAAVSLFSVVGQESVREVFQMPHFELRDLGPAEVFNHSLMPGLGPDGHVVFWKRKRNGRFFPVRWTEGKIRTLAVPPGYSNAFAFAINAVGTACGWANTSANPIDSFSTTHAIRFTAKSSEDLATLPGGHNSAAYSINRDGVVAGISDAANGTRLGFRWREGRMQALPPLTGGANTTAFGINDQGHIAGVSDFRDPKTQGLKTRAVIWEDEKPIDIHPGAEDEDSVAYALNSFDDAVGRVSKNGENQAFLCSKNSITRLGVQGTALSINDRRDIVGVIDASEGDRSTGFLWRDGTVFDLNDLVVGTMKMRIEAAFRINAEGEILCLGRFLNGTHIVLLFPRP